MIPTAPIGPKHLARDYADVLPRNQVHFVQVESVLPALNHRFLKHKHGLTHDDMTNLRHSLAIDARGARTRDALLDILINYCVTGESVEYQAWFRAHVKAQDCDYGGRGADGGARQRGRGRRRWG